MIFEPDFIFEIDFSKAFVDMFSNILNEINEHFLVNELHLLLCLVLLIFYNFLLISLSGLYHLYYIILILHLYVLL